MTPQVHRIAVVVARVIIAALGTIVFLLFIPPPRAGADVLFPPAPHAAAGEALFRKLPASLRRITGQVRELDEPACRERGFSDKLAGRAFSIGDIELRQSCWDAAYLLHELGHEVWWQILSDADRDEWGRFWGRHQAAMPRDYARTDAAEGWADSFSVVYMPDDTRCVPLGGVGAGVAALIRRLAEQGDRQ